MPPRTDAVRSVILVERYLPAVTPQSLARLADTRAAVDARSVRSVELSYLTSIAVSEDETCFCLFAGASLEAVRQVNSQLNVPSLRTVSQPR